jgi:hypothetical protein
MRQLGWAFGGVVLGFLIGGVGPNRELAELNERYDALQDENLKLQRRRSTGLDALGAMDRLLPGAALPTRTGDGGPDGRPSEAPEAGLPSTAPRSSPATPPSDAPPPVPAEPMEEFEAAVEVQAARAAQTRAALAEQADLSDAELEEFDAITDQLNLSLADHADQLVELALLGERPAPSALFGLTHEVSGVLLESQESLEALLGEDVVAETDPEALLVLNHVDLEIFRDSLFAATAP